MKKTLAFLGFLFLLFVSVQSSSAVDSAPALQVKILKNGVPVTTVRAGDNIVIDWGRPLAAQEAAVFQMSYPSDRVGPIRAPKIGVGAKQVPFIVPSNKAWNYYDPTGSNTTTFNVNEGGGHSFVVQITKDSVVLAEGLAPFTITYVAAPANVPPIGKFDATVVNGTLTGWVCDPNTPGRNITVRFYDTVARTKPLGVAIAQGAADASTSSVCGGQPARKFSHTLTKQNWKEGQTAIFYAQDTTTNMYNFISGTVATVPDSAPTPSIGNGTAISFESAKINGTNLEVTYSKTITDCGTLYTNTNQSISLTGSNFCGVATNKTSSIPLSGTGIVADSMIKICKLGNTNVCSNVVKVSGQNQNPISNRLPVGLLEDGTKNNIITGWACDPDSSANVVVKFYDDANKTTHIGTTGGTNLPTDDENISNLCHGNKNRGFRYELGAGFRNPGQKIVAFAIDLNTQEEHQITGSTQVEAQILNTSNRVPEIVDVSLNNANPTAGQSVSLLATVEDPEGSRMTYTIQWGDVSTANDSLSAGTVEGGVVNRSHMFKTAGAYTISLSVTDAQGMKSTKEIPVVVKSVIDIPNVTTNKAPVINSASFSKTTIAKGDAVTLNFKVTDANSDALKYEINWGDQKVEPYTQPFNSDTKLGVVGSKNHTYASAGKFTATLKVSDVAGLVASKSLIVNVNEVTTNSTTNYPPVGVVDSTVTNGYITGWACDPTIGTAGVVVFFYNPDDLSGSVGATQTQNVADIGSQLVKTNCGDSNHMFNYPAKFLLDKGMTKAIVKVKDTDTGVEHQLSGVVNLSQPNTTTGTNTGTNTNTGGSVTSNVRGAVIGFGATASTKYNIYGWACDPDRIGKTTNNKVSIKLYTDSSKSTRVGTIVSSASVTSDEAKANCGGEAGHGFNVTIPSDYRKNGQNIAVFATDIDTQQEVFIGEKSLVVASRGTKSEQMAAVVEALKVLLGFDE